MVGYYPIIMSINESGKRHHPPEENNAASVFDSLDEPFSYLRKTLDMQRLTDDDVEQIASIYTMTSIRYFANHSDDYLNFVGTAIAKAFNDKRLELVCERKSSETDRFGIEILQATGKIKLLIPLEFIVLARVKPVLALASILGSFSRIVDLLNDKSATETDNHLMIKRAEATQAQFLKLAQEEGEPSGAEINSNPQARRVLDEHPSGIYGLAANH